MDCLPERLKGRRYYVPTDRGLERKLSERLAEILKLRENETARFHLPTTVDSAMLFVTVANAAASRSGSMFRSSMKPLVVGTNSLIPLQLWPPSSQRSFTRTRPSGSFSSLSTR